MENGLTSEELEGIYAKHKRIRGSHKLKYPARHDRCKGECGELHYRIEVRGKEEMRSHPCFLALDHEGRCEFSSECNSSLVEVADKVA